MIRFQTQRTKLPIRSAAARRGRINTAAFVVAVATIAQILSACSNQSFPAASVAAQYPDLNDPSPKAGVRGDQAAQLKAELIQLRDNQERAAALQQTLH
jgi:hypothetical protein